MSPSSPFHVRLESERVKLVPFEVPKHASLLVDANPPDSLYGLTLLGPFDDVEHFKTSFWTPVIEAHPDEAYVFAVYDKTRAVDCQNEDSTCFAGIIGFMRTSFVNLATEIAGVVILPAFQRTHVTSNAVGLLMQFALDLPDNEYGHPGLGMRRVVWTASTANPNSVSTAKRMGFQQEGIMRWDRVLPAHRKEGGNGKLVRQGDPKEILTGRDTVVLSVCWDDWEGGVRRQTIEAMNRKS